MKRQVTQRKLQTLLCLALLVTYLGFIYIVAATQPKPVIIRSELHSAQFQARVINVSDGDSITVRSGEQNIKIRLAQIDAPERSQPWGNNSRQALAELVEYSNVLVSPQGSDRYGGMIAHVSSGDTDVNAAMIKQGAAWAYRDFLRDSSLITLENEAKSARKGLWAMPESQRQPPWEYRAQRRKAAGVAVGR